MARADGDSPRARLNAAGELCGVDLILECELLQKPPQSPRPRSKTMEQDGLAPVPVHGSTRTEPRSLERLYNK